MILFVLCFLFNICGNAILLNIYDQSILLNICSLAIFFYICGQTIFLNICCHTMELNTLCNKEILTCLLIFVDIPSVILGIQSSCQDQPGIIACSVVSSILILFHKKMSRRGNKRQCFDTMLYTHIINMLIYTYTCSCSIITTQ